MNKWWKSYRIIECKNYDGNTFIVQKRSIFGFWYNMDNYDAYTTGIYYNIDDARESVREKIYQRSCIVREIY